MQLPEEVEQEEEEVEADSLADVFPYNIVVSAGDVLIVNLDEFVEAYGAQAIQVVPEGGMFYLNKEGQWVGFPVSNKKPAKLKPVQ